MRMCKTTFQTKYHFSRRLYCNMILGIISINLLLQILQTLILRYKVGTIDITYLQKINIKLIFKYRVYYSFITVLIET